MIDWAPATGAPPPLGLGSVRWPTWGRARVNPGTINTGISHGRRKTMHDTSIAWVSQRFLMEVWDMDGILRWLTIRMGHYSSYDYLFLVLGLGSNSIHPASAICILRESDFLLGWLNIWHLTRTTWEQWMADCFSKFASFSSHPFIRRSINANHSNSGSTNGGYKK